MSYDRQIVAPDGEEYPYSEAIDDSGYQYKISGAPPYFASRNNSRISRMRCATSGCRSRPRQRNQLTKEILIFGQTRCFCDHTNQRPVDSFQDLERQRVQYRRVPLHEWRKAWGEHRSGSLQWIFRSTTIEHGQSAVRVYELMVLSLLGRGLTSSNKMVERNVANAPSLTTDVRI